MDELTIKIIITLGGIIISCVSYFITTTLAKIDENQTNMQKNVSTIAQRLAKLEGEHYMAHSSGTSSRRLKPNEKAYAHD